MKMNKNSLAASTFVLALLVAGFGFLASPPTAASAAANAACTQQTDPFSVTGANWGTPGSPISVYPGDQDVPLTVTLLFSGPCTSPQTTFYLGLTQGPNTIPFVGLNGVQEPEDVSLNISPNTLVTETYYLNVDQNALTGLTYYIPLIIDYSNNTSTDIVTQTTQASGGPLTAPIPLYGPVQLSFGATPTNLVPGEVNNVTITITNTGSAVSGPVSTAVTAPTGVTLFNQLATTTAVDPGSSVQQALQVFVPASMSGGAFVLTFTAKYLDAYSNSQTATQTIGFTATASVETSSFVVEGATWGSSGSTTSPLPGAQDTPLAVSLQYLGSAPETSLQGTVQLPSGMTNLNGGGTAVAYSAATTNQYGAVTLTFYIDIASTVGPGSYNFTLSLVWMTSQSSGLTQTSVLTPPPIAQIQSSFQVEGTTWERASNSSTVSSTTTSTSPEPGAQGVPLVVSLQYLGTTSVASLKGVLSLPSGVTDVNGHSTATAFAATASTDQLVTLTFDLDFASTLAPGSYNFTLALSWTTSNSVGLDQTAVISPPPVVSGTTTSFPLSVTQANSTLTAGSQKATSFTLANDGTATIYAPTFSLTVGSPVVLASIGSPVPVAQVGLGGNTTFTAQITSGPSAASGIYSGTLTVSFTDSSGTSHSQTFPVSFTLEGTIILILQNTAVSQTATGFTVTGTILDEGSASAYYASISGLLGVSSATPVYLGEIDPNTPLPFSVTIPFTAPATVATSTVSGSANTSSRSFSRSFNSSRTISGNFTFPGNFTIPGGFGGFGNRSSAGAGASVDIAISLSFKDNFGNGKVQAFTVPTTVKTASQLSGGVATTVSSSSSDTQLKDIAYGVVAVVAATLVVGGFMARRYRAKRLASLPPDQRGEQSVI
ncbi:MAG: NEW3 domain-containing protein [Thaumarchaeota archaeon]|nr:NEW3 domain-containing protein [Nitrososphaerota archaeon]